MKKSELLRVLQTEIGKHNLSTFMDERTKLSSQAARSAASTSGRWNSSSDTLKHDGFRALAHIWDGKCELVSRRRNPYKSFQLLKDNLAKLKVNNAVIDGELVCLDSEGRSIFNELLFRRGCPVFYAFDLLYLNGRDLRQLPLIARKEKLKAIIEKSAQPDVICRKYVEERGIDLFQAAANTILKAW